MNFKGGVIVIGSLLWDESAIRSKWRKLCLMPTDEKVSVPLNIRYGRQSSTRDDTFTMMFSNHQSTKPGRGYIIPFIDEIKNYKQLEEQAFALACAEGIWKENGNPAIVAKWGAVGLLINPQAVEKDANSIKVISDRWTSLYEQYTTFDHEKFRVEDERPTISKEGFLQIEWTEEMDMFDILIATPVKAKPDRIVTVTEIANMANDYFNKNLQCGVRTYQDSEIVKSMKEAK